MRETFALRIGLRLRSNSPRMRSFECRPHACALRLVAVPGHPEDPTAHGMGHEYCGIVEEVGSAVETVKPGQFVTGSFFISDNTCPNCQVGYQSGRQNLEFMSGQRLLVGAFRYWRHACCHARTPFERIASKLLATSDVLGTGWFAADAANVKPGSSAVVVGDGAAGLLGVLSTKKS